jgi:hypothetical protein
MSGSRIKTLVVAALVLVNAFFLTVIIIDTVADARSERQAVENVCAILRAGGIMIEPDDVVTGVAIRTMRAARVSEAEAQIARAVLGHAVLTEYGIIHLYENPDRGFAEFRSAGVFEIHLNEGVITNSTGTLRAVQRVLRDMRFETSDLAVAGEPGYETVTAVGAYRGVSIFNCSIEFVFAGGSLEVVRGRHIAGIELAEDGADLSQVGTALLGFLAEVRRESREDVVATRIYGVEPGYQYRVVGSFGEGILVPAWLITTDTGNYIIDCETGEISLFA